MSTESGGLITAFMPVHVLGDMCDIDRLATMSAQQNLPIIEDATEALGTSYKGRLAGMLGQIGTFSFNGNKLISTGGGMLLTNDSALSIRAKHLATAAKAAESECYHDEVGFNYRRSMC